MQHLIKKVDVSFPFFFPFSFVTIFVYETLVNLIIINNIENNIFDKYTNLWQSGTFVKI